jgi:hypothetical protein
MPNLVTRSFLVVETRDLEKKNILSTTGQNLLPAMHALPILYLYEIPPKHQVNPLGRDPRNLNKS